MALVSVVFSAGDEGKAEDADMQPVSRMTAAATAAKGRGVEGWRGGGEGGRRRGAGSFGAFRTAILRNQFNLLFISPRYIIKGEGPVTLSHL